MRGIVVGAATVALLCAGCSDGEGETVEITTTDSAGQPTVVTQEVTQTPEEPEETTDVDAAPTTVDLVAQVFDVPGGTQVALDLPQDWTIEELGEATRTTSPIADAVAPQQWCLVPPNAPPAIDGCSGILLAAGGDWLPGAAGAAYSPRQVDGWRSGPGPLACPFGPDGEPADTALSTATPDGVGATQQPPDGSEVEASGEGSEEDPGEVTPDDSEVDLLVTAAEGMPLTSVQTQIDGRAVTYETWRASCSLSPEVVIVPQVWHDVDLHVLVRDYFGMPETAVIVESLRGA